LQALHRREQALHPREQPLDPREQARSLRPYPRRGANKRSIRASRRSSRGSKLAAYDLVPATGVDHTGGSHGSSAARPSNSADAASNIPSPM